MRCPVVVINLAHRRDRRDAMTRTLREAGIDPETVVWYPAIDPRTAAGFKNPGYRGCFLSHLAVINWMRNARHETVLILEDDCDFTPEFPARLQAALEDGSWHICYLGHPERAEGPGPFVTWPVERGVAQTHCYAVRASVPPLLGPYLEAMSLRPCGHPDGGPMSPDGALNRFRRHHPEIVTCLAAPSSAHQRSTRSDLAPNWFDRVPCLAPFAETARRLRRALR